MSKEQFEESINYFESKIKSYNCLICDERNLSIRLFYKHLENKHNMDFNQYRINFEFDGITPLCSNPDCKKEIKSNQIYCSRQCGNTVRNKSLSQREISRKTAEFLNSDLNICNKRKISSSIWMKEYNKSNHHREIAKNQKLEYFSNPNNEREISLLAGRNTRIRNIQLTENKNIETNFYIVKIKEDIIKVGITRIDQNRIDYIKDLGEVIFQKLLPFYIASELEIFVLNKTEDYFYFKSDRFDIVGSIKGTTELRTINSLPYILKLIEEFFKNIPENTIKALERIEHL